MVWLVSFAREKVMLDAAILQPHAAHAPSEQKATKENTVTTLSSGRGEIQQLSQLHDNTSITEERGRLELSSLPSRGSPGSRLGRLPWETLPSGGFGGEGGGR